MCASLFSNGSRCTDLLDSHISAEFQSLPSPLELIRTFSGTWNIPHQHKRVTVRTRYRISIVTYYVLPDIILRLAQPTLFRIQSSRNCRVIERQAKTITAQYSENNKQPTPRRPRTLHARPVAFQRMWQSSPASVFATIT